MAHVFGYDGHVSFLLHLKQKESLQIVSGVMKELLHGLCDVEPKSVPNGRFKIPKKRSNNGNESHMETYAKVSSRRDLSRRWYLLEHPQMLHNSWQITEYTVDTALRLQGGKPTKISVNDDDIDVGGGVDASNSTTGGMSPSTSSPVQPAASLDSSADVVNPKVKPLSS